MKKLILIASLIVVSISFSYACGGRNILYIWVTADSSILVDNEIMLLSEVKDYVKDYIGNPNNAEYFPEKKMKEVPFFGNCAVSKGIVSIQSDRSATYGFWIAVNNEIEKAYNEMRNELALKKFGVDYKLLAIEKQKAINMVVPKMISEAEPVISYRR